MITSNAQLFRMKQVRDATVGMNPERRSAILRESERSIFGKQSAETPPEKFALRDLREKHWFWIQNEMLDVFAPLIGPYAVGVYLCLARSCEGKRPYATASLRDLEALWRAPGEDSTISRSTISRSLALLVHAGMIQQISPASATAPAEYGLVSLQQLAVNLTPMQRESILAYRRRMRNRRDTGVSQGDTKGRVSQ